MRCDPETNPRKTSSQQLNRSGNSGAVQKEACPADAPYLDDEDGHEVHDDYRTGDCGTAHESGCTGEDLQVSLGRFFNAIESKDVTGIGTVMEQMGSRIVFNQERAAVQILFCAGDRYLGHASLDPTEFELVSKASGAT